MHGHTLVLDACGDTLLHSLATCHEVEVSLLLVVELLVAVMNPLYVLLESVDLLVEPLLAHLLVLLHLREVVHVPRVFVIALEI